MTSPHSETESLPIMPSMPDFASKPPLLTWDAGDYFLMLVEHPDMMVKTLGYDVPILIDYEATLAVIRRGQGLQMLINLERTDWSRCICGFTRGGIHENYGPRAR